MRKFTLRLLLFLVIFLFLFAFSSSQAADSQTAAWGKRIFGDDMFVFTNFCSTLVTIGLAFSEGT